MTNRTVVKHYSWIWGELPSSQGAAWSEEWTYDAAGALIARRRIPLAKKPDGRRPTISTDPRAGAIMREELGLVSRSQPMGGPHH